MEESVSRTNRFGIAAYQLGLRRDEELTSCNFGLVALKIAHEMPFYILWQLPISSLIAISTKTLLTTSALSANS